MRCWILVGQTPIEVNSKEWARWFEKNQERIVAQEKIGEAFVSTVFLGLDHSYSLNALRGDPDHVPELFESMVFGGQLDELCWRYRSYIEASVGHKKLVKAVKQGWKNPVQPSYR